MKRLKNLEMINLESHQVIQNSKASYVQTTDWFLMEQWNVSLGVQSIYKKRLKYWFFDENLGWPNLTQVISLSVLTYINQLWMMYDM